MDTENEETTQEDSEEAVQHVLDVECLENEEQKDVAIAPILSPFVRAEREKASRDFFRSLLMPFNAATTRNQRNSDNMDTRVRENVAMSHRESVETERRVLEEPDLRIPFDGEYLYLAQ